MIRVIVRRLVLSIPLLFIVSILTFLLTGLVPGNPAATILGTTATPDQIAAVNKELGFDRPLLVRYWDWLSHAVTGDLGNSLFSHQPVVDILGSALPVTLTLIIGSILVSAVVGILLGTISAQRSGSSGRVIGIFSILGYAVPPFFLGLLLVLLFSNILQVLPPSGWVDPLDDPADWFLSIVLPILTLSIPGAAVVARQTRQGMLDVLQRDYIRSLRSRGIPHRVVIYRHALRNAAGDVVTLLGLFVVSLLLGTTLVETVFAMQGLGSIAVNATSQHDLPVLQGAALYFTFIVIASFLIVDVTRVALNPKLRSR
jgi:peptide/nickel transport system permease protein